MINKNDIGYFSVNMGIYPRTLFIAKVDILSPLKGWAFSLYHPVNTREKVAVQRRNNF